MTQRYWPMVHDEKGIFEFGDCPECGHEAKYQPTQEEADDVMFYQAQGFVQCTKCKLELPVQPDSGEE